MKNGTLKIWNIILREKRQQRLKGETRDSRGAVSNKDRRLNRICGGKGLSSEFREREKTENM